MNPEHTHKKKVAPAAKDKIKSLAAQEAAWQDEANRNASLMQAARNQDLATVKALLDKKVNIYAQDAAGWTALHHAAKAGHANVALHLVDKGGQRLVAMTNKRRETAMDLAILQHGSQVLFCFCAKSHTAARQPGACVVRMRAEHAPSWRPSCICM